MTAPDDRGPAGPGPEGPQLSGAEVEEAAARAARIMSEEVPWTPPADDLVELERRHPGFLDRWMAMAEKSVDAAIADQERRTDAQLLDLHELRRSERRAQDLSWLTWFVLVVLTAVFLLVDQEEAAIAFGVAAAVVLLRGIWRPSGRSRGLPPPG
jgi:uncharacterized membrane protein